MSSRSWSRRNRKMLLSYLEDRFCPPIQEFFEDTEEARKHLSICKNCNQRIEEMSEVWDELPDFSWESMVNDPEKVIDQILPGEIRRIHSFGYHWDERGLYHNEPLVVVLQSDEEYTKVSLLNTFGSFLFGNEEIKLHSSISAYAECWNTFGVQTRLVGSRVIDKIPHQQVEEILKRSRGDFRSWERRSSVWHFHITEVRVGWYYSRFNFIDRGISEADTGGGILEGKLALQGQLALED